MGTPPWKETARRRAWRSATLLGWSAIRFWRRSISADWAAAAIEVRRNATIVRMLRSLTFFLTLTLANAAQPFSEKKLNDKISAATAGFTGTVSIFAKNLDTGATFALRADDRVRTASTIKLPILCATFEAVKEGRLKWTDLTTLRDADKVSGSGILGEFSDGVRIPLADLTHLMIVVSDNTATNLVLDQVTANYVNEYLDKLGLKGTRSMRKVLGDGANLKPPSGYISQSRARSGQ